MKLNVILSLVFISFILVASSQQVTELHYKKIQVKDGKAVEDRAFIYGKDFMKIESVGRRMRYIDKKSGLTTVAWEDGRNRDYIIETTDSVYYTYTNLVASGEKKIISGYNCEKFITEAAEGKKCCDHVINTFKVYVWITNDIKVDDSYNLYISSALFPLTSTFKFSGVIVKVELPATYTKKDAHWALDSVVTDSKPAEDFERPWKKYGPEAVLILPGSNSAGSSTSDYYKYTNERETIQYARMKELAIKVTGFEKPKSKTGWVGIALKY